MLINHYTDHKQHTTQPPQTTKTVTRTSCGLIAQQVLNVNPTACLPRLNAQPNYAPTPTTQTGSVLMQAQETHTTQKTQANARPQFTGSLERR